MITKIKKIKNLGIFLDYSVSNTLTEFKKYNLIYGWNGSGKTTLTRLFDCFQDGRHGEYPNLEYELECGATRFRQGQPCDKKIRVFNQDYVSKNIKILEGKANSISVVLGAENAHIIEQIKSDEKLLSGDPDVPERKGLLQEFREADALKKSKETEKNQKFTDIARTIGAAFGGEATRSYRANDAKGKFIRITEVCELSHDEFQKNLLVLQQRQEDEIRGIELPTQPKYSKPEELSSIISCLEDIQIEAKSILRQTVTSRIIQRLKENADISAWVETGLSIHKHYDSKNCEYCNQPLPAERVLEISQHFNDEDKKLKENIEKLLGSLRNILTTIDRSISIPDRSRFYEDFRTDYDSASGVFIQGKKKLIEQITAFGKIIADKKQKTTEEVTLETVIDTTEFTDAINSINELIKLHNLKISNLSQEKEVAKGKIELHFLSTIYQSVHQLESEISGLDSKLIELKNGSEITPDTLGIDALRQRIADNKAQISNTHKACEEINKGLQTFLGREELLFEPYTTPEQNGLGGEHGYEIKRKGVPAKHLSEGEKTAIAFVYFTVHLGDQDFDINNGIVVIDDPISSLDTNSLFQAFAFLKVAVKNANQVFVLTHNYDFLRLLINWLNRAPGTKGYFMIQNIINAIGEREATISKLDKLLESHETEYHYLFKLLYNFSSNGTIESVYHVPNVTRKVLETFLMFRVPNSDNMFKKMEKIPFDEIKKSAIYKFVNDQSHITGSGFDPSLIPETQNNVKALLELMKAVFPEHYEILTESIAV